MLASGKLIVFEGPDGVGKSTLVGATVKDLQQKALPVQTISFPGKESGTLGWLVDQIHHGQRSSDLAGLTELSLQALHIAAHLDHIESRIQPALRDGTYIILDRFWWSTFVYGCAANVQMNVLERLIEAEKAAWVPILPAQVFLINRTTPFRPEHDEQRFARLSGFYSGLADREASLYPIAIIANDSIDESLRVIRERLDSVFKPEHGHLKRQPPR